MSVSCIVNWIKIVDEATILDTEISGSVVMRNRLGYRQYKTHSPDHLSNQK